MFIPNGPNKVTYLALFERDVLFSAVSRMSLAWRANFSCQSSFRTRIELMKGRANRVAETMQEYSRAACFHYCVMVVVMNEKLLSMC